MLAVESHQRRTVRVRRHAPEMECDMAVPVKQRSREWKEWESGCEALGVDVGEEVVGGGAAMAEGGGRR